MNSTSQSLRTRRNDKPVGKQSIPRRGRHENGGATPHPKATVLRQPSLRSSRKRPFELECRRCGKRFIQTVDLVFHKCLETSERRLRAS